MVDYSLWLQRAEAFVRSTSAVPGQWDMDISIAPPLSLSQADQLNADLPNGLPSVLRDFYLSASAHFECQFHWTMDGAFLERVREVFPYTYSVASRPKLCAAAELAVHQQNLFYLAEVFDDLGTFGRIAAKTMQSCVPLINIGNGDYIALDVQDKPESPRVMYFSHEADMESESPIIPLADSGEQFLADWGRVGWIGPEIWLLDPFLSDSTTGLLEPTSSNSIKWRAILESVGAAIVD